MKCKQVTVATDNVAGIAAHGEGQELVIPRIATDSDFLRDDNHFRDIEKCAEKLQSKRLCQVLVEFGASQHLVQLGHRRFTSRRPRCAAASKARRGPEPGSSTALTNTLVSMTTRNSLIIEQRLQLVRS